MKKSRCREGSTWFEQNGRRTLLSAGEWSIYDTMKACSVSQSSPIEQLVLLVLRNPGQSIDQIAEALHCGKLNLHKVFSHADTLHGDGSAQARELST